MPLLRLKLQLQIQVQPNEPRSAAPSSQEIYSLRESVRDLTRKLQQQKEKSAHFSQLAKVSTPSLPSPPQ